MAALDLDRFEVLTFDCYGTLIDWEAGILAEVQPILAGHGISLTDDDVLERYARIEAAIEGGPYRLYRDVLAASLAGHGRGAGVRGHARATWPRSGHRFRAGRRSRTRRRP